MVLSSLISLDSVWALSEDIKPSEEFYIVASKSKEKNKKKNWIIFFQEEDSSVKRRTIRNDDERAKLPCREFLSCCNSSKLPSL